VLAAFVAQPNVDQTLRSVADLMKTYNVKEGAAWYQWP
jgi:hypothetical protein